tara:strand:- start:8272 stop:9909 length:1638 start_codon:yes stop_codon:yes gene_type:complete
MDNNKKLAIAKEAHKRKKLRAYKGDFELFCKEQIRILTKNATMGFVPFEFNDAQVIVNEMIEEQLKRTGKVRAIILKGRQMGLSTYSVGRVYWKSYFNAFNKSVVMAHDTATSDALFAMSRNTIANMPEDYRPTFKKSNSKEIMFEHNDSGYRLYTAGSPEAGRGTTPTIAHLSEVAFWGHDEKILAGLFQGISEADGTEVILESTANGVGNEFHRLWKGAVAGVNDYIPIFVPWTLMTEYRRKVENPEDFEESLTEDEKGIRSVHDLDLEQLYWRRLKIAEGTLNKFKQEYPLTAEEAFQTSGSNVFNIEKLQSLIPSNILKKQMFNQASSGFEDFAQGDLEIFEYPKYDANFVIGADCALGVGQDYSSCSVMNTENKVVALYRNNKIDPSMYGDMLFYLGRYYNNALLAVESNSLGIATLNRLKQMNYVNLYHQTKVANVSKEEGSRLGWRTTQATKPMIIAHLKNAIENDDIDLSSSTIIQECLEYVSDANGRTNAITGGNDDTVIGTAIALEVLRTHRDRLVSNKVGFQNQQFVEDQTVWL